MRPFGPFSSGGKSALRGPRRRHADPSAQVGLSSSLRPDFIRIRDAFRVEPLEPRVLLSADPLFSPLKVFFLPEDRAIHDRLAEASLASTGTKTMASPEVLIGSLNQVISVPVRLQSSPAVDAYAALDEGVDTAASIALDNDWRVPFVSVMDVGSVAVFDTFPIDSFQEQNTNEDFVAREFGEFASTAQVF